MVRDCHTATCSASRLVSLYFTAEPGEGVMLLSPASVALDLPGAPGAFGHSRG
jgi:hypothetical protein